MLKAICCNPYINLIAGLILLTTSGYEIFIAEEIAVGSQHGLLVYGLLHSLRSIPEITHGLDNVEKAHEELEERKKYKSSKQ